MKQKFFFILLLVLPFGMNWADSLITYESRTKEKTIQSEMQYKASEGYREKYDKDFIISLPSCLTSEYTYQDPKTSTGYTAIKKGKEIWITGMLNGQTVNKTLALEGMEWLQSWALAAKYASAGKLSSYSFTSIRPDTAELMEFEIKYQNDEPIAVNGETVPAMKYRISLKGLLAIVFSVDYWVRSSDGVTLRLKSGNNETLLVSEKNL